MHDYVPCSTDYFGYATLIKWTDKCSFATILALQICYLLFGYHE